MLGVLRKVYLIAMTSRVRSLVTRIGLALALVDEVMAFIFLLLLTECCRIILKASASCLVILLGHQVLIFTLRLALIHLRKNLV